MIGRDSQYIKSSNIMVAAVAVGRIGQQLCRHAHAIRFTVIEQQRRRPSSLSPRPATAASNHRFNRDLFSSATTIKDAIVSHRFNIEICSAEVGFTYFL